MKKQMGKKGRDKKKFSLREFIWLGFNYTVGIGFIGAVGILSNGKAFSTEGGVGLNTLWILAALGIIAGIIAWAFAKMSRMYKSAQNGGAYIFVRGTFGKFLGIFVAFMMYVGMPFIITNQVMMMVKGSFSPSFVADLGGSHAWFAFDWGSYTDLWLDLIGITIYMSSALIIFAGIKVYKKFAHTTAFVKWGAAIFLILIAIIMMFVDISTGDKGANIKAWGGATGFNIGKIMTTFSTCFYFFAGFEIFSTAGANIENPNRNIGLGVTIIMIISTIFYIAIMFILFMSIAPIDFSQNATMSAWNTWFNKDGSKFKWMYYLGPVTIIISAISLKINAAMQNSLYGGTVLQPLCVEGYFPQSMGKLNKDGLPLKASMVNLIIVAIFIVVWLALPDLIKGIQCTGHAKVNIGTDDKPNIVPYYWVYKDAFNVATLTEASAVVTIFVYMLTLASAITMSAKNNKLKLRLWEIIAFNIALIILTVLFIYHYYDVGTRIYEGVRDHDTGYLIGGVVEVGFIVCAVIFCIVWYKTYYKKVVHNRDKTNTSIQIALDREFQLIPEVAEQNIHSTTGQHL